MMELVKKLPVTLLTHPQFGEAFWIAAISD